MARPKLSNVDRAIRQYQNLTEVEQLAFDKRYQDMKMIRSTIRKMAVNALGEKKAKELFPRRRDSEQ